MALDPVPVDLNASIGIFQRQTSGPAGQVRRGSVGEVDAFVWVQADGLRVRLGVVWKYVRLGKV